MSEVIIINSANRLNGNGSNFNIDINYEEDEGYDRCSLIRIAIPKSYYLIDADLLENTFTLQINAWTTTITLANGVISRNDFRLILEEYLNDALDVAGCPVTDVNALWRVTNAGAYDLTTTSYTTELLLLDEHFDDGLYLYSLHATDVGLTVSFILGSTEFPAKIMGVLPSTTISFTEATTGGTHHYYGKSSLPVNFEKYDVMYLRSNIIGEKYNLNLIEIFTSGSDYFGSIIFENTGIRANSRKFNNHIKNASFSLVDKNENNIDLNGSDIVFSVLLYRDQRIDKKIDAIGDILAPIEGYGLPTTL